MVRFFHLIPFLLSFWVVFWPLQSHSSDGSVSLADEILAQTIRTDSKRYSLHCVRKERIDSLQMGKHGNSDAQTSWQNVHYQDQIYRIYAKKQGEKVEVVIYRQDELLAHYLLPFEFSFDTTMDLFHFKELQVEQLNFLANVSCRFSQAVYDFTHRSSEPLLIGVHTEGLYFADTATEWFNQLFDSFPNGHRLITRDTNVLNAGQRYIDQGFLDQEAGKLTHLVVTHKDPSDYKLSPGGWLLFRFTPESSNRVILAGGFLNMCMSNTMVQLANALLSSNKSELVVDISRLNSYAQHWGMTNALTLPLDAGSFPLWMLQEQYPEVTRQYFNGLRQYLNVMTKNKVEILFEDETATTTLPVFRIKVLAQ